MDFRYMALFGLLMMSLTTAFPGHYDPMKEDALESAMDNVVCRVEFSVGVMESHIEHLDAEELQDHIDTLEADVDELQEYVDDADAEGFRQYLRGTYVPNQQDVRAAVLDARLEANMTYEIRQSLMEDYTELKETFDECNYQSIKNFAEAKLEAYDEVLATAQERADNLTEKGVETDGLEQIIEDAEDEIVDPLQSAVDDAEDAQEIRDALRSYCMFNGCFDGTNFHFAAKTNIERLYSILEVVEDDAIEAGLEDEVEAIEDYLADAEDYLQDAGTSQYTTEQAEGVWDNIKDAAETLKEIVSELRSE